MKRNETVPAQAPANLTGHALINRDRVSELLADAGPRKIRALVARGEFAAYRFDGRTVYSLAEVAAYVERVTAKPGRAAWRGHVGVQG